MKCIRICSQKVTFLIVFWLIGHMGEFSFKSFFGAVLFLLFKSICTCQLSVFVHLENEKQSLFHFYSND